MVGELFKVCLPCPFKEVPESLRQRFNEIVARDHDGVSPGS